MKIRLYGKTLEIWTAEDEQGRKRITQREIRYYEYDSETGERLGIGSEDFSPERQGIELEDRWIWTWDGERRNKGGNRWFEDHGLIRFRKSEKAEVKRYLKNKFGAAELQLR